MQFLNDKFFRVAVILFFFLMALPFMFSTPEPEKKDNTPVLEFEDKNPVYNIINRIAKFYGLKKENKDKDFTLNNAQISQIKKQIAEKKEKQLEQSIKEKLVGKTYQNTDTATSQGALSKNTNNQEAGINSTNNNPYQSTNTYVKLNNEIYEILKDKENKQYLSNGKTLIAMESLPKSVRKNLQQNILMPTKEYQRKDSKTAVYANSASLSEEQNELSRKQNNLVITDNSNTQRTTYQKNSISSFFKPTTKAGQDLMENLDNSIKNINFIKQNKPEQERAKTKSSYIKNYKAQIFNPITKKTQEVSVQQEIETDDIKIAEEIKKITRDNIASQNYTTATTFNYLGRETTFPSLEEIASLNPREPTHLLIEGLQTTDLDNSFRSTFNKAIQKLPNNPKDLPFLEFVYESKHNKVLRAPNNSFNVLSISRLLADKVKIPNQNDIDFLDTKGRIYVVPDKFLYEKYKNMKMPVIFYPELSPQNFGQAYDSAKEAIDILISNKEQQLKTEQNQNKEEIEKLLTSKE